MENQNQINSLVCPTHKLAYFGVLTLGILVGGGLACAYFLEVPVEGSVSYRVGFDTARKLVEESPTGAIYKVPDDIRSISGVVTKVEGNKIVISIQSQNPFVDKVLLERVVVVAKDTQITKISHEGREVFRTQMEAFMKDIQYGKVSKLLPPTPPEPTRTTVAISSIVVGDTVSVSSVENIKDKKEFTASTIEIF